MGQALHFIGLDLLILAIHAPALIRHQPILPANGGQALVGIVLAQGQAIFAAAGHHAVGVHHALGDQIVHQRAQIAGMPRQNQFLLAKGISGGIQARQQALRSSFLIAAGAVELARAVKPGHDLAFQGGFQAGGVHTVILNGISRAHDLDIFKPNDAAIHGDLHILGQAAAQALQIHFLGVFAAGLHKDLMMVFFAKTHHLILNAGAIAGPHPLNHAAIQRAAVNVGANDLVRLRIGKGNVALHLVVHGGAR